MLYPDESYLIKQSVNSTKRTCTPAKRSEYHSRANEYSDKDDNLDNECKSRLCSEGFVKACKDDSSDGTLGADVFAKRRISHSLFDGYHYGKCRKAA